MLNAHQRYQAKPWEGSSHLWAQSSLSQLNQNLKVLDIGPGSGVMGHFLKQAGLENLYAVEIDPETTKVLNPLYKEISNSIENLSEDNFDLVFLLDVLEHMEDPGSFLETLKSKIHTNTRILISVPNIVHWSLRIAFLFGYFDYMPRGPLDQTHLRFFSKASLHKFLKSHDYQILQSSGSIVPLELFLPETIWSNSVYKKLTSLRKLAAHYLPGLFAFQHLVEVKL